MSTLTEILWVILVGCLIAFRRDWIWNSVTWLDLHNGTTTAVATLAIAVLTYFLVTTSDRQWQTTTDSFHADQRPWVGAESTVHIPVAVRQANGTYLLPGYVTLKNFGPRVARQVYAFVGATDDPNSVWGTAMTSCSNAWQYASGDGRVPYWTPIIGGTNLFPEQMEQESISSALQVTLGLPDQVFIPGCIEYIDQFDEWHGTLFCFKAWFDGARFGEWNQCEWGNDAW
ncbi:hypothetical protein [Candidatus Binatus sp.]|uniref:hypothetical protein n=1 Tax=Candidatus Binatus sp. TaxID=2811406 RepID=UPI003CC5CF70